MAGLVFVLDLLFAIQVFFFGDGSWLVQSGLILSTAAFGWVLFVHPRILIFDEGITVVNPFATTTFGWAEVESIETQYAFTVESPKGRVVAWAAPAPGRYHARNLHATELKGVEYDRDFGLRPGDSPKSQSGAAANVARKRLVEFRKFKKVDSVAHSKRLNHTGIILTGFSLAFLALSYLLR